MRDDDAAGWRAGHADPLHVGQLSAGVDGSHRWQRSGGASILARGISSLVILKSMRRLLYLLVVIWLVVGVVAVGQRGYFGSSPENCAGVATIAVTVVAGPLNYMGVNPKINCRLPQPSS